MNLTETNFNQFRNDVLNALAAVAEKYGCEATMGNIKYDMSSIDATLYFKAKGENGESAEEAEFKRICEDYGFKPEDYNAYVILDNKAYRFVGFNPRARKNHCIIKDTNGKQFVCPIASIRQGLGRGEV
jgi:hypothetical protein